MATTRIDKYAGYRYKIVTPEERREAKWLIEQGDFKDMEDYIDCMTRIEKRIMKRQDAANNKLLKQKSIVRARSKAA